jgi:phosphatidylinositol glycan class Z
MTILTWVWAEDAKGTVPPDAIYYALRVVMFILSFVLEDWAIFELVHSPRHRSVAVALVASSYVTWTFQTHTFSNSLETLLVAWSLVLIDRITHEKVGSVLPKQRKSSLHNRSNGHPLGHALFFRFLSFSASSTVLLFQLS